MSEAMKIGPLLLPTLLLVTLLGIALGVTWGKRLSQSSPVVETLLWHAVLAGVVLARLAFVVEYRSLYASEPWTVLNIRDGGWNPLAGLVGAWLFALARLRQLPQWRRAVQGGLALGSGVLVVGVLLVSVGGPSPARWPDMQFADLAGKPVALRAMEGRPTVVNLWATWCGPCVREMPVFALAQRQHPGVNFVFLNQGESPVHVAQWLAQQGVDLQHVWADPLRAASAAFQQKGYPTTLFFDGDGTLMSLRVGELSTATLEARLRDLSR